MKLLAIDAATEACSVALLVDGLVAVRYEVAPRGHAQRLLPMVDAVLAEAGIALTALDAIAFDRGPGSFTGVRVGTSVTQGLAFGADLPVIPVSSLATIAQGAYRDNGAQQVLAIIDARMAEVYWGQYQLQDGVMVLQGAEHVCKAEVVKPDLRGDWYGAGTGWQADLATLQSVLPAGCTGFDPQRLPHAEDMLVLAQKSFNNGEYIPAEQALPTYLRNEVAHKQSGV